MCCIANALRGDTTLERVFKMNENSYKPPITNRGVVTTLDSNIKMCIDWCQATIFGYDKSIFDLFDEFFGISSFGIVFENKALYGYDRTYSWKDIKVFCSSRDDMGIHILLSGKGCRDIEDLGINFVDLFSIIRKYNGHFTRLDVAIDNFSDDYFTMDRVKYSIKNNLVVSRFKNSIEFIKTKLDDNINMGYTIWFGSRSSNIQVVFYDKLKERECQNIVVNDNIKFWTRCEIRFRNDYASEVVVNLIEKDFNIYILSLLNNYIKFIDCNYNDSNRCRIPAVEWWNSFLKDIPKIKLYNSNYVRSITRTREWCINSTSRSNAMVLLSTIPDLSLDNITCNYLVDFFNNGFKEVDSKDLQYINDYRISKGLLPITLEDFKYLVGDIKDFMLERKQ